jgi:hypothetical protein
MFLFACQSTRVLACTAVQNPLESTSSVPSPKKKLQLLARLEPVIDDLLRVMTSLKFPSNGQKSSKPLVTVQ